MRRHFGILTCAIAISAAPARGHADSTDEALRRFFPDRDLSKAVLKIADPANGYYAVGDSLEVTKDGRVRTTNAVVIQVIAGTGPNQSPRYTSQMSRRMVLKFAKPVQMPSDVAGNKIVDVDGE